MRLIWSALERWTAKGVPKPVREQVHNFIDGELTEEFELQDMERRKDIASILDLEILLYQLWALDDTLFKYEQIRIQMALLIMLVAYTTTRPGTIVESSSHRESNEALCYKIRISKPGLTPLSAKLSPIPIASTGRAYPPREQGTVSCYYS
ncbi:hypothetical protein K440DRAFT_223149 [Wilcoxina mikolae CBS 423.85]|nr:hypothetical protein K440DRAFT_223149 [Wilcoxina mikolae CBS 423.85]